MTAEIPITSLTAGTVKDTDVYPAVDTTDTTQAATGTTKKYNMYDLVNFQLSQLGFDTISPCRVATTAALTVVYANGASGLGATLTNAGAQAALSIDGKALALTNRVLVKDQAAPAQNGIYAVTTVGTASTNWVLTRATDWDVSAEMADNQPVVISEGTVNGGTVYQSDVTAPVVVGTDAINFTAFSIGTGSLVTIPVPLADGGTNKVMVASNGAIVYCDADSFELSAVGSIGQVLQSNGAAAPTWSTPTYPSISGTVSKFLQSDGINNVYSAYAFPAAVGANGTILSSNGTNYVASTATYPTVATSTGSFLYANGTNWVASTSLWANTVGSAGVIVRSNGTTNVYSTSTFADTYAINSIPYASAANTITALAPALSSVLLSSAASTGVPTWSGALTNGQLIIGSTGATPAVATLTAGAGISISNGAGSITISSGGSGFSWTEVTGTTQAMAVNNGYVANNAAQVVLTLPTTAAIGDSVTVVGKGAGGWRIAQNAGETIYNNSVSTTTGTGGYVESSAQYNAIELVCITANNDWVLTDHEGALTFV